MNNSTPRILYSARLLFVLLAVVAASLLTGGRAYYTRELRELQHHRNTELKAIAELKVGQIAAWRTERLRDAHLSSSGIIRIGHC